MPVATSPYLNRPTRTLAQVEPIYQKLREAERQAEDAAWTGGDPAPFDREARRLRRLLQDGHTHEPNF